MPLRLRGTGARTSPWTCVAAAAALVVVVRVLLARTYVGGDEAGFLMVGAGWHDGSSLYGDHWVDRPPLLLWITDLAGTVAGLRVIGCLASVLTVLGVARAAALVRGPESARWAAGAAALFLSAQWLGVGRVNGELLAAPFVAWSIALTLQAGMRPTAWRVPAAMGSGALALCALFVKQSTVEAFVFALAFALVTALERPEARRVVLRVVVWGALGGALAAVVMLVGANARGTGPRELFDAVVTFRAEAGEVIRSSASGATSWRLFVLVSTWAASGLGAATVLATWHGARRREPALVATVATLAFGLVVALLGGSYWAHYLIQPVPAASLAVGLLVGLVRPPVMRGIALVTVVLTLANMVWAAGLKPDANAQQHEVGTWLRDARRPADTAVVTYGQPNILHRAKMTSPYVYLWSLPVRTRDPQLRELSAVLTSRDRPTWVVDWSGLDSWGIEPGDVPALLRDGYRTAATICDRTIWLRDDDTRSLPAVPEGCP